MSYEVTRDVYAELAGVPLATPAWECLNPMELAKPAKRRGQDRVIAGAAGVRVKRRRKAVTRRTLTILVFGGARWDAVTYSNHETGLQANLAHLYAALMPTDGTAITATVHTPAGGTITGSVQIEEMDPEYHSVSHDAVVTVDVTIPGGELS